MKSSTNMKGMSNMSLVSGTNRSNNQLRQSDYAGNASEGPPVNNVMMNNFAGPSDTQNFATQEYEEQMAEGMLNPDGTPFMGNHVVKTVRNLRMR